MIVVTAATRSGLEGALRAARAVDRTITLEGLNAVSEGAIAGRIDEAWGKIEVALKKVFGKARDEIQGLIDETILQVDLMVQGAGQMAAALVEGLLRRIQVFTNRLIASAFGTISSSMTVGGATLRLKGLNYSQKLSLSGSLKASLTDAFGLTANGEITVSVSYDDSPAEA